MSNQTTKRNLTTAIGAALASSFALGNATSAENPFSLQELQGGYMQVAMQEGSCGGAKGKEGSCGSEKQSMEGRCGGDKAKEGSCGGDKAKEGSCGGDKASTPKAAEGKCGEGKCGGNK